MVKANMTADSDRLDAVFHALSDPTRRSILRRVSGEAQSVGEIAGPFAMSLAAVSKHLKVLERADLIARDKQGSFQMIRVNPVPMQQAHRWLSYYEEFWGERLDALAKMFDEKQRKK
jgi:DNA-binding transcriptional ArsR family regulator